MNELKKLNDITLRQYCILIGFGLIFTGILLFAYSTVLNIALYRLAVFSNPLFYLPMGLIMLFVSVFLYFVDEEDTIL